MRASPCRSTAIEATGERRGIHRANDHQPSGSVGRMAGRERVVVTRLPHRNSMRLSEGHECVAMRQHSPWLTVPRSLLIAGVNRICPRPPTAFKLPKATCVRLAPTPCPHAGSPSSIQGHRQGKGITSWPCFQRQRSQKETKLDTGTSSGLLACDTSEARRSPTGRRSPDR